MMAFTQAGRYQIGSEIGRGAMGIVYQGFDPLIGRNLAIKSIKTDGLSSAEYQEHKARFVREAQAAGVLGHPTLLRFMTLERRREPSTLPWNSFRASRFSNCWKSKAGCLWRRSYLFSNKLGVLGPRSPPWDHPSGYQTWQHYGTRRRPC